MKSLMPESFWKYWIRLLHQRIKLLLAAQQNRVQSEIHNDGRSEQEWKNEYNEVEFERSWENEGEI